MITLRVKPSRNPSEFIGVSIGSFLFAVLLAFMKIYGYTDMNSFSIFIMAILPSLWLIALYLLGVICILITFLIHNVFKFIGFGFLFERDK